MLMLSCCQIRAFRPDGKAVKGVADRYHTSQPVVVRALVAMWEAASDEQRKNFLHKAATDTLEENSAEIKAVEDRRKLMCRNPTRPAVHG